jgi:hypothetical protein
MLGYNGPLGIKGTPGIPGDKFYVSCCGLKVNWDDNIGWYCDNCKKVYITIELVSLKEFKNLKRTKTIDKILNEKRRFRNM